MPDKVWRLVDTDARDPYFVTAADEVLALSRAAGQCPDTLHFYRRNPPGVSVGYFKNIREDVDLEQCQKLGVKVVRRTSGGGTIYTDEGQLIYGLATSKPLADTVEGSFEAVCSVIVKALGNFGIQARPKPPNDITINGRKVSGNAQSRKGGAVLHHGTIILTTDPGAIERVLRSKKSGYVSSIQKECGFIPDLARLKEELARGFEERFDVRVVAGELSKLELEQINSLVESKYSQQWWNFKR